MGNGQVDVFSLGVAYRVMDRVAVLLRDGHRRHLAGGLQNGLVRRIRLIGVGDDEGGGRRSGLRQVAGLEVVGHRDVEAGVHATLVFEDDGVRQVVSVRAPVALHLITASGVLIHDPVGLFGDVAQAGHRVALAVDGDPVRDFTVAEQDVGRGVLRVDRGDRQGGSIGGRLAKSARVGVGGKGLVLPRVVTVRGGEGIVGRGVDGDARVHERLIDVGEDGPGLAAHAGVVAQRDVDDVGLDDQGVVEGSEHSGVGHDAVGILDDLGDDDLRVRGAAANLTAVSGCDGGDVRAVVQVFFGSGYDVGIVVGVVVGEGDFVADPRAPCGVGQARRECSDVRLRHAQGGGIEGTGEGGVARVEAGVDDFDNLVVAFLGGLVGAGHFERGRVLQDGRTSGGSIVLGHGRDAARNDGGLDTLRALDSSERGRGCLDREALERVGVLTQRRDARGG